MYAVLTVRTVAFAV